MDGGADLSATTARYADARNIAKSRQRIRTMPTDEQYREKALEMHLEISDAAIQSLHVKREVSGAWVTLEVWVSDDEFDNENGQFGVGA